MWRLNLWLLYYGTTYGSKEQICLFSGEPSESTGDCHLMSAVTDTTSVTSTDSNLPQYQMIVNRSADSSSSFCMEHSSYSDRSDTEVLLRGTFPIILSTINSLTLILWLIIRSSVASSALDFFNCYI